MAGIQQELIDQAKPIVEGMGFTLVELGVHRSKGQCFVAVVVHRAEGVGIDECAAISRTLLPRLELVEGLTEVRLEVSSPGLDRILKSAAEYEIFKGRGILIWLRDAADWLQGVNLGLRDGMVELRREGQNVTVRLEDIVKAKLDSRS